MYRYLVEFIDDMDNKVTTESGIVGGATYGEAADNVVKYYGKDNILSVKLDELEDVLYRDAVFEVFSKEGEE